MPNLDKKLIIFISVIFVFQLIFPQYSYAAVVIDNKDSINQSILAIVNSPQPIIFDPKELVVFGQLSMALERQPRKKMKVAITAYSSTIDQTDSTPFITANGSQVRDGIVAANFLSFGTKIKIPKLYDNKVFSVEDRMNKRYYYHLDIWMPTREEAKQFGVKYVEVEIY